MHVCQEVKDKPDIPWMIVSENKEKDIPTGSPAWEDKKGVGVEFV